MSQMSLSSLAEIMKSMFPEVTIETLTQFSNMKVTADSAKNTIGMIQDIAGVIVKSNMSDTDKNALKSILTTYLIKDGENECNMDIIRSQQTQIDVLNRKLESFVQNHNKLIEDYVLLDL